MPSPLRDMARLIGEGLALDMIAHQTRPQNLTATKAQASAEMANQLARSVAIMLRPPQRQGIGPA